MSLRFSVCIRDAPWAAGTGSPRRSVACANLGRGCRSSNVGRRRHDHCQPGRKLIPAQPGPPGSSMTTRAGWDPPAGCGSTRRRGEQAKDPVGPLDQANSPGVPVVGDTQVLERLG